MTNVQDFKERIEQFIFSGQELEPIEHSLYQVGNEHFVIAATKPEGEKYFFGINSSYVDKADFVILVCGNDLCAFKIPTSFIKELEFNIDKKTERYLTVLGFDNEIHDWYITQKASEEKDTKVYINDYFINLKKDEEIIQDALAIRKLLKID